MVGLDPHLVLPPPPPPERLLGPEKEDEDMEARSDVERRSLSCLMCQIDFRNTFFKRLKSGIYYFSGKTQCDLTTLLHSDPAAFYLLPGLKLFDARM
jgi:hypothetical protein